MSLVIEEKLEGQVHFPGQVIEPRLPLAVMDLYISMNVGAVTGLAGMEAALSEVPVLAIQWIPEYSVGNADLDEQHKVLFTMINDFFHQSDKESAILLFQNLSSYIDLHFEAEESLLRQINYPDTDGHIKKHADLRGKFTLLEGKLDDYDIEVHHKIGIFLYNWLAKHILEEDMDYKSYALSIEVDSFAQ